MGERKGLGKESGTRGSYCWEPLLTITMLEGESTLFQKEGAMGEEFIRQVQKEVRREQAKAGMPSERLHDVPPSIVRSIARAVQDNKLALKVLERA